MQERGETEHRHEQFVLQKYFDVYAPKIITEQEYHVYLNGKLIAKIDLADLTNKIAWRLNGEIHTGVRAMHDEDQKELLESLGWTVLDIPKDSIWYWLWV